MFYGPWTWNEMPQYFLRRRRVLKNITLCGFVVILIWILYSLSVAFKPSAMLHVPDVFPHFLNPSRDLTSYIDKHALPGDGHLFQSTIEQEFPSTGRNGFRIPHIIHQIYTDDYVPQMLVPMIKSFIKNNPSWQYMFWTYASGETLIKRRHPYLLNAYKNFTSSNGVKKVDMLRLVVLYEFGGFYADMDVMNLRPLDKATEQYACILPVEPFEHAAIYNVPFFMSNAVMLCRPRHPFIKFSLMNLVHARDQGNPISVTGPAFITNMFKAYNRIPISKRLSIKTDMSSNSPSFYKGTLKEVDNDAVYVPNSQYFIDTVSPILQERMTEMCSGDYNETITYLQKRACVEFRSRNEVRQNSKYTFTVHYWLHLWSQPPICLHLMSQVHIKNIAPNRIIYD